MISSAVEATVLYTVQNDVAFVTLDAPPLNILSAAIMLELAAAAEQAQADPSVKALVLQAKPGSRAFSAGADVGEHRPENAAEMIAAFSRLFAALGACELPVIAVVDGAAMGAGFELAMMADILLASDNARFAQPEIRLGFFAPVGVAWLARRIGPARAIEVTSTGRTYSAAEMHDFGLVSRVVARDDARDETEVVHLRCAVRSARARHLDRACGTNAPCKPRHSDGGEEPQPDLRLREPCVVAGEQNVRHHGQLESGAHRGAVDHGDDRQLACTERGEQPAERRDHLRRVLGPVLAHISACGERAAPRFRL